MNVDKTENYNSFFRQILFVGVLIALGWVLFDQLSFFIGSALGAITLYVLFRGLQFRLVERYRWHKWFAALMITVISLVMIALFGWWVAKVVSTEMPAINMNEMIAGATALMDKVNDFMGFKLLDSKLILRSEGVLTKMISALLNSTYNVVFNIIMMLIVLYFMLSGGRRMEAKLFEYAPFSGQSLCMLKREFKNMIYSNAVGIPVILVGQTLVASLLYYLVGFNNYLFWGVITAICGLIPLIGSGLVYFPMGIYFAATGKLDVGILVIVYGLLIISNIDNLVRIVLLGKYAHTHPLIVIFGVIIGIPLFGFWGIIFGPLFISGFMLLIKIYFVEYGLIEPGNPDVDCVTGAKRKKGILFPYGKKRVRQKTGSPAEM